jgi:hypothetical protein
VFFAFIGLIFLATISGYYAARMAFRLSRYWRGQ